MGTGSKPALLPVETTIPAKVASHTVLLLVNITLMVTDHLAVTNRLQNAKKPVVYRTTQLNTKKISISVNQPFKSRRHWQQLNDFTKQTLLTIQIRRVSLWRQQQCRKDSERNHDQWPSRSSSYRLQISSIINLGCISTSVARLSAVTLSKCSDGV